MRYAKLSCTEYYSCYLQQCHSIDLFSNRTLGHGQKGHMNKVLLFRRFLGIDSIVFSETQHGIRGPCGALYDRGRFFENHVLPPKWGKQDKPRVLRMYRKVQFFFSVLYFFINLVYNESLYYCNSCMLEQISYLGKFWFLRYGPKCSWPIRLQDFSINRRTLKLAVSHKEINEINWFLVCPSNSFLRNGSLGFSDFWHNGR